MNSQDCRNWLRRSLANYSRYGEGTFGRRQAVEDIIRGVEKLVDAKIKEILADKDMTELEALAKELQSNSTTGG